jgi:predicted HTH transcriptional regulator
MGEGVDPTKMCQSLVDKVSRSEQLRAVTDPDILVLFEDWLDELEQEVLSLSKTNGSLSIAALTEQTGLSHAGASFLLAKLKREGKI